MTCFDGSAELGLGRAVETFAWSPRYPSSVALRIATQSSSILARGTKIIHLPPEVPLRRVRFRRLACIRNAGIQNASVSCDGGRSVGATLAIFLLTGT